MELLIVIGILWLAGKSESILAWFHKSDTRSWPEKWADHNNNQQKKEKENG